MLSRIKTLASRLLHRHPPPVIPDGSFIVWEPCTYSHAEVVPGYVRYLLDLGFQVAVFVTPRRFDEGLFSRFSDGRISLNRLSQRAVRRFFRENGLSRAKGILITTARKISGKNSYEAEYALLSRRRPEQRVLLVEHDVKGVVDRGVLSPEIITLRAPNYKKAASTVVNPHYFGEVRVTGKNREVVEFITIGALRGRRRNTELLIHAVNALHERGIANFRITVIGRGNLWRVPRALRRYFDIRGRLSFAELYAELERSDFFLTLLDPENPRHDRYITTGTSGSFQLIYGFSKPCLIAEKFAAINGFDRSNSIVYPGNDALPEAMQAAVRMTAGAYAAMQQALRKRAEALYAESLTKLRNLIESHAAPK